MLVSHKLFLAATGFFHLLGGPKEQLIKMKGLYTDDDDFAFVIFRDGVVFVWSETDGITRWRVCAEGMCWRKRLSSQWR